MCNEHTALARWKETVAKMLHEAHMDTNSNQTAMQASCHAIYILLFHEIQ